MAYVLNRRSCGSCGGPGRAQQTVPPEIQGYFSPAFFERVAPNWFYRDPCHPMCEKPCRDHCGHCRRPGEYPMPCRRPFEDVVYKGPCAPCCHRGCPNRCDDGSYNAHALFAQQGTLSVVAEEPILLRSVREYSEDVFREVNGRIFFHCGGTFLVSYTVNVPAADTLTAQFRLRLDGETVPGSVVEISKTSADSPGSVSAQALVYAERGMALDLVSDVSATLVSADPDATLASLTLLRVS